MDFQPFCTTEIEFLSKQTALDEIGKVKDKNIVMILSISSARRWKLDFLVSIMRCTNNVTWIDAINANPTQDDVFQALKLIEMQSIDQIIAIGGGSAIDLAKGISAFFYDKDSIFDTDSLAESILQKTYQRNRRFIDIIAIPTTAGTGSELTQWATIWDVNKKMKYSIDSPGLFPKKALIVPELTLSMSKELTLSTGLDALSHATEAYWSRHTDPLVQELAYRAIQLILEYLPKVLNKQDNLLWREAMCRASVLAGMAFSKTRTTACHSISYPLTMLFGIAHGLAVAMTLGEVGNRNRGCFPQEEALYQLFEKYGGIQDWLDQVSKGNVPLRLSAYAIEEKDIEIIAQRAFTAGRMDNNPVVFTEEDVRAILHNIY